MVFTKMEGSIRDQKLVENLTAENLRLQATTDYLSMMTGIEIPINETENEVHSGGLGNEQI